MKFDCVTPSLTPSTPSQPVIPGVVVGSVVTEKYGNAFAFALGNLFTALFQVALLVVGVHMEANNTGLVLFLILFLGGYPVSPVVGRWQGAVALPPHPPNTHMH